MTTKPSSPPTSGGRNLKALERRRLRAARLFERGANQAQVVRELGVSAQTASRWHRAWRAGGRASLRAAARLGRPDKLTPAQWQRVERALEQGSEAHGFAGPIWTLARIAGLIEELTGVVYGHSALAVRLYRAGWSVQRPRRRALERDEAAVATWMKETWPTLTGGR